MQLISSHLAHPVATTWQEIANLIARLVDGGGAYALVAQDETTYAQVLWTGSGFILEHQAGSADRHFRAKRHDFDAQDIIAVLSAYCSLSPDWSRGIEFERTAVNGPLSFRLGQALGRVTGAFI
jgi:hypothetical protein